MSFAKRRRSTPTPLPQLVPTVKSSKCDWICSICREPIWTQPSKDILESLNNKLRQGHPPLKRCKDATPATLSHVEALTCGHVYHKSCLDLAFLSKYQDLYRNPNQRLRLPCPECRKHVAGQSERMKLFFAAADVSSCSDDEDTTEEMNCTAKSCKWKITLSKERDFWMKKCGMLSAVNQRLERDNEHLKAQLDKDELLDV